MPLCVQGRSTQKSSWKRSRRTRSRMTMASDAKSFTRGRLHSFSRKSWSNSATNELIYGYGRRNRFSNMKLRSRSLKCFSRRSHGLIEKTWRSCFQQWGSDWGKPLPFRRIWTMWIMYMTPTRSSLRALLTFLLVSVTRYGTRFLTYCVPLVCLWDDSYQHTFHMWYSENSLISSCCV